MNNHDLRQLRAELEGELMLGRDVRGPSRFCLSLEDLKETSVHIIGAAGFGKSYYLRHLIDQFLVHGQPFGLIDPHRELYEYALWRLRRSGVRSERIVLLDPGDQNARRRGATLGCRLDPRMEPGDDREDGQTLRSHRTGRPETGGGDAGPEATEETKEEGFTNPCRILEEGWAQKWAQ